MKTYIQLSAQLNENGPNEMLCQSRPYGSFLPTIIGAIVVAVCLQSCVSIGTPRAGQPVIIQPGQAFVFGRIRMFKATNGNIEYSPFFFDPWGEPFFVTGPRMTLELRQIYPPGGAFKYKVHPAPPIEADGSFFWLLSAGDYMLCGNPRLYGSKQFTPNETSTLARFSVSSSCGTIYVGTLIISIVFDLEDLVLAGISGEAEYEIQSLRVKDEHNRDLSKLREHFPAIPEPVITNVMIIE